MPVVRGTLELSSLFALQGRRFGVRGELQVP